MNKENNKKITDYLTKREINALEKFANLQLRILNLNGCDEVGLISFKHKGIDITNPFVDEIDSCSVDPVEYYREDFLNSDFMKIFD